jgi:hypothetical protein
MLPIFQSNKNMRKTFLKYILVGGGTFLAASLVVGYFSLLHIWKINSMVTYDNFTNETMDGAREIVNRTAGYAFEVPSSWYVDADGSGATIYPDYVPGGSSVPQCKLELSVFENSQNMDLSDWMANYFSKDPTVVFHERSMEAFHLGGVSGILWKGEIDGIDVSLIYAPQNGKIYEFAPSSLALDKISNSDCAALMDPLFEKLHLGS